MWRRIKPLLVTAAGVLASVAVFVLFVWAISDTRPLTPEEMERFSAQYLPPSLRDRPASNDVKK